MTAAPSAPFPANRKALTGYNRQAIEPAVASNRDR